MWEVCGREPFAHPAYVELFAVDGASAQCAVSDAEGASTMLPFLIRPVRADDWEPTPPVVDAISPYGYGGPYGPPGADISALWAGLARWMGDHGVVSFFGRLALGDAGAPRLPAGASIVSDSENVVVDLRRDAEEQWRSYDHKVRKNVNKARRSNLQVEVRSSFTDLGEFTRLYRSTMDRRQAADWYYFDSTFFESIVRDLDECYLAAEVRDDTAALVSAELVLSSDRYLYSFLGGTRHESFDQRPNDLLKHAVIEYGRASGHLGYVLGGGQSPDDGIFRYKRSFDRTGCVPFRRLTMIGDEHAYRALVADRLGATLGVGVGVDAEAEAEARLDPSFFPLYRAPLVYGTRAVCENGAAS